MSTYVIDLDFDNVEDPAEPYLITDPADLDTWFDMMQMSVGEMGHPCPAQIGPAGQEPVLVFGLEPTLDVGAPVRGVIRWLPTGEYGYDPDAPEQREDLIFDGRFIDALDEVIAYAPDATRVTGLQVMDAIRQYVRTGERPGLAWRPGHHTVAYPA